MTEKRQQFEKAYIVTVDMGYGHQRAMAPLEDMAARPIGWEEANGAIITANTYPGIPQSDQRWWEGGRSVYEKISRMKHLPIIGDWIFGILDRIQRIQPFYPKRDLSKPNLQLKQNYTMINRGWGKHLIDTLNKKPLPLVTSFFTIAFFAEEHGYEGDIYCLCTDTDVSRTWAPMNPSETRIKYFAPNRRVKERLKLYGVPEENIYITGFPLPQELIGDNEEILRQHVAERIVNLDPSGRYRKKYAHTLEHYFGDEYKDVSLERPLTVTFAVGGAGAQREIGAAILRSLHDYIDAGAIQLNLVAGARNDVYRYYESVVNELHLSKEHEGNVHIIYHHEKSEYFKLFNEMLKTTDILWTKPSELSFFTGLGIPIIMAPPIGSQEHYNRSWLQIVGGGVDQLETEYAEEWLFDWLQSGWLAESAMNGFLDAPRNGAYHIKRIVLDAEDSEIENMHLL